MMDKISSLLLPLALVFAAIAVFETGARYGASNMRAHAIASELQLPLSIYISGQSNMDARATAQWTSIIDHSIATGAIHRQLWYLNEEAKSQLDKALTIALSVRGDATANRYELIAKSGEEPSGLSEPKLKEIQSAIDSAKVELIDNAPKKDEADQLKDSV